MFFSASFSLLSFWYSHYICMLVHLMVSQISQSGPASGPLQKHTSWKLKPEQTPKSQISNAFPQRCQVFGGTRPLRVTVPTSSSQRSHTPWASAGWGEGLVEDCKWVLRGDC